MHYKFIMHQLRLRQGVNFNRKVIYKEKNYLQGYTERKKQ